MTKYKLSFDSLIAATDKNHEDLSLRSLSRQSFDWEFEGLDILMCADPSGRAV